MLHLRHIDKCRLRNLSIDSSVIQVKCDDLVIQHDTVAFCIYSIVRPILVETVCSNRKQKTHSEKEMHVRLFLEERTKIGTSSIAPKRSNR